MPPTLRKFMLILHIATSVGWLGAVAAYLALDITAATSRDAELVRAAYLAMERMALYVIVPLALAALLTGLVMSLGTKWGLIRHYWILISFLLTVVAVAVLLAETQTISYLADEAAGASDDDLLALDNTLAHSIGGTLVLLVVLTLNVYKPRGLTRYGWRKQRQERQREASRHT